MVGLQEDESDFAEKEAVIRLPRRPGLQTYIFRIPLDRLRRVENAEMHVIVRQRLSQCGRYPWRRLCRSEEHTSELQSLTNLVCRLLLEKKKKTKHLQINTQH